MRQLTFSMVGALFILALAEPAQGQAPRSREGFWWGLGFSYGWVHVSCDICAASRGGGMSATGVLGGTINSSLRLGGELNGWTRSEEAVDEYFGSVSAVAYWYPEAASGLYLKGGLVHVAYRIDDDENALTSSGFGPQVGAGYELSITRRASVQPYLNLMITVPRGNLSFNGDRQAEGVSLSLLQLGLSVTWH